MSERVLTQEGTSYDGLLREIARFRQRFEYEGLPSNWYDLPDTGFMINTQLGFLSSELDVLGDPEQRRGKLLGWLSKTESDIRAFALEYLVEGLVFPIHYKIGWIDGERRIINTFHGEGKKLVDTVSVKERKGVVKKTIAEVIEPFLLDAPEGSLAVMISPSGPSGMTGENKKQIVFQDCQTYILQKRGEEIVGATVRTDFNRQELRELILRLTRRKIAKNAPAEEYVSIVATFNSQERVVDMNYIVDIMCGVRGGSRYSLSKYAYKDRTWEGVYRDIERLDWLLGFDGRIDVFIQEFREFALAGGWSRQELKEALAGTVLRVARTLRKEHKKFEFSVGEYEITHLTWFRFQDDFYGWVLREMQSLPGCAGGGRDELLIDSLVPRWGIEMSESGNNYHIGSCIVCGKPRLTVGMCSICKKCEKECS